MYRNLLLFSFVEIYSCLTLTLCPLLVPTPPLPLAQRCYPSRRSFTPAHPPRWCTSSGLLLAQQRPSARRRPEGWETGETAVRSVRVCVRVGMIYRTQTRQQDGWQQRAQRPLRRRAQPRDDESNGCPSSWLWPGHRPCPLHRPSAFDSAPCSVHRTAVPVVDVFPYSPKQCTRSKAPFSQSLSLQGLLPFGLDVCCRLVMFLTPRYNIISHGCGSHGPGSR